MAYPQHLEAFVKLGTFFNNFANSITIENDPWLQDFKTCLNQATLQNAWFTPENLNHAIAQWGQALTKSNLTDWLANYNIAQAPKSRTVAIIMAGNIPLVGFHDFLSVLVSGHKVLAKLSSNDQLLLPFIAKFLIDQEATLADKIEFTQERLQGFDAVIATGSNNTGRYFEHYFSKYPHIIRKNRNSVAILTGTESPEALAALGEDIFRYFGLGCRSVSKIFVPENYDFDALFKAVFKWKDLLDHHKYVNNYDYNKAVYLMSELNILDNGFLVLKEDNTYGSPIATLFYEYYQDQETLSQKLEADKEALQCIVGNGAQATVAFGQTQQPTLKDYADGVDTISFLTSLT